jgi:hypothetical protein
MRWVSTSPRRAEARDTCLVDAEFAVQIEGYGPGRISLLVN